MLLYLQVPKLQKYKLMFSDIGHSTAASDSYSYIFRRRFPNEGNQWFIFTSTHHLWKMIMLNCNKLKHHGGALNLHAIGKTGNFLSTHGYWLFSRNRIYQINWKYEAMKFNTVQRKERFQKFAFVLRLPFFTWAKNILWRRLMEDRFRKNHARACYGSTSSRLTCLKMISHAGRRGAPVLSQSPSLFT